MIDLDEKLNIYAQKLSEWFLTGIKPDYNYLIDLKLHIMAEYSITNHNKLKINNLLNRIDILIKIGL
jgi:hypothetical protein